uniref:Uncharacterized protein n=1 Tax=Arundo donax TaxID=35708 RepID=A0A0A9B8F4_ARUDO
MTRPQPLLRLQGFTVTFVVVYDSASASTTAPGVHRHLHHRHRLCLYNYFG